MTVRPVTDFRTYPGDRPTRLTPAARRRRVERAERLAQEARELLVDVCADFSANGYRLPHELREEWREAARRADALREVTR